MSSCRWLTWWILVLMFVSGCLSTLPPGPFIYTRNPPADDIEMVIPVYVDQDFGSGDRIEMQLAIDKWNYALNGHIKIIIADRPFDMSISAIQEAKKNNGWIFMKIESENRLIPKEAFTSPDNPAGVVLAFCNKTGGDKVWFVRDIIPKTSDMFGITLHEIGHLMGAEHQVAFLMAPHYNETDYRCIDKDTMIQVSKHIHVPVDNLNYCFPATDQEKIK